MKLLIGGSPCTHWSIAQTKNRETEASGIGWELFLNYRIARDKYQPDYFLYENNKSMSPAIRAQITAELGVEPVLINSALVSAQNRQRLYWAGKRNPDGTYRQVPVELPEDRGILLRDILETGFPLREKGYALQTGHGTTAEDAIARRQRNAVAEPVAIKPLTEKEMEYMVRETKDGHKPDSLHECGDSNPGRRLHGERKNHRRVYVQGIYPIQQRSPVFCGGDAGGNRADGLPDAQGNMGVRATRQSHRLAHHRLGDLRRAA